MKKSKKTPHDTSLLASELRAQLSRLKRRLREEADPGKGELTSSQIAVILNLEKTGRCTVSELSRMEGVRHQSMRATVAALKKLDYIESRPDTDDGRKIYISLTKSCRRSLEEGREVWNDWLSAGISEKLSPEERGILSKAVGLIKRLADD